jgi:hypothetical protein
MEARVEGFFEARCRELENQQGDEMPNRLKSLEYDLAEMTVENNQLKERVKTLANRTPAWPKGYRPQRTNKHNHK